MKINSLKDVIPPWVVKFIGDITLLVERLQQQIGKENLFILNGLNMKTYDGLYDEFTSVFNFPDYFGRNINALDECLNDLEWLNINMLLIIIINSEFILCEENHSGCETIIEIFEEAGIEWSKAVAQSEKWDRDPVPFHAIMQVKKEGVKAIDDLPELKL